MSAALLLAVVLAGCGDDDAPRSDAGATDGATADASGADAGAGGEVDWPNEESRANSDPWLADNHDRIRTLRPRILALDFVNGRSVDEMRAHMGQIVAAMREGTRHHGYEDAAAAPAIEPEIAYAIDLRDSTPPAGWPHRNGTLYPREEPQRGNWGFDYAALFSERFATLYGIEDPDAPGAPLDLCTLVERGLVHEVWVWGDADVPDVSAAEILAIQARYDDDGRRLPDGSVSYCAANGCFDLEDEEALPAHCTRTVRIGWVNHTRGVGCYMESTSHGIEGIATDGAIPYFTRYFREYAGFDLDVRFGLPWTSWYTCRGEGDCLAYPTETRAEYDVAGARGAIDPYVPVCGNAHFPPNARDHYDIVNDAPVRSRCRGYRRGEGAAGADLEAPTSAADWSRYGAIAGDCTGAWLVWWWQNVPGRGNGARDDGGRPMKSWWPFLYY